METNRWLRFVAPAVAVLLMLVGGVATATNSPGGTWNGVITLPGTSLEYTLTVNTTDSGLTGAVDIPAQGASGIPTVDLRATDDSLIFGLKGIPGSPTFMGAYSADGDTVAGDFSQAGATFPFTMTRVSAAEVQKAAADLDSTVSDIRHLIDSARVTLKVPGVAVAIVKNGEVILSDGFGYRNVADSLPVTSKTLFAIGSSSKAFTTMAIGMLVDDGKIDWDEKVGTYLPWFRLEDEFASDRVTVRDLVTHRTGLPRYDLLWYGSDLTRDQLIRRIKYLKADKGFRTTFQYQNLMFLTAGVLAGHVNGSTWEDLIRNRILDPLGMTATDLSVTAMEKVPDRATGYTLDDDTLKVMPYRNIDNMAPAGAINSNVDDMAKWVELFLDKGKVGDKRLISEAQVSEMYTCQIPIGGPPGEHTERLLTGYGLGWFVEAYRGHYRVQHGGNIDGFSALVSFLPYDGIGIVVLTNMNGTALPSTVSLMATDRLLGLEPVDWLARADEMMKMADSAMKASEKSEEADRVAGTKPSHKLEDYAGSYENPAFGTITITYKDKKLHSVFHSFDWDIEHWHYDVFKASEKTQGQDVLLEFCSNTRGDIDRFSAALEPSVDPIVFVRKASADLLRPEYLQTFLGKYTLAGTEVTVSYTGERLQLSVPGQPAYTLEPYKNNEFTLKDVSGYSVVFKLGKDGAVTAAEFHQPNGVFTAERVPD